MSSETLNTAGAFSQAKDLKKVKGFDAEVNLSKYTLQKGIMQLEKNNFIDKIFFYISQSSLYTCIANLYS